MSTVNNLTLGSITNDGLISTTAGSRAIEIDRNSVVGGLINTGTISGGGHAVELGVSGAGRIDAASSGPLTGIAVFNSGTIMSTSAGGFADSSALQIGSLSTINGNVVNTGTGSFSGYARGINLNSSSSALNGSILNDGALSGGVYGVYNTGTISGSITNNIGGTISGTGSVNGTGYAIYNTGGTITGSVTNNGTMTGTTAGVYNSSTIGGLVNNGTITATGAASQGVVYTASSQTGSTIANTGSIAGATGLLLQANGDTVNNTGTITGTGGTAISITGNTNALNLGTGTVLNGAVTSTGTGNTLTLQGAANVASNLTGFSSLTMSGTSWTLGGTVSTTGTTATATNVQSGSLIIAGDLANGGTGGGTTIASGAGLQIGNGGATGSVSGDIVDDGLLTFNRSNAYTFGKSVSGTGGLTQAGTGTLTLAGFNTYTGSTTISSGTLLFTVASNLGTGGSLFLSGGTLEVAGNVSAFNRSIVITGASGTIQTDPGFTFGVSGVISGGALVKTGSGNLFLNNTNTYTGGTTIAAGNLFLSGANASILGDVIDNGGLVFANTSIPTFGGTISGTGNVSLQNSSLALTGTNSYAGNTSVSGGVLSVGADANLGAAGGGYVSISTGGTLRATSSFSTPRQMIIGSSSSSSIQTDPGVTLTASGPLIGVGGALNKTGAGTLVLTGTNTYSAGTTISAGTLQIGNGGTTGSILGNVTNNAALVFNRSNALSYAGSITGTGTLTQAGTGVTTLTGTGSSVGSASVAAGTLNLAQAGAFATTGAYTTATGATTQIAANATLAVGTAFTQAGGSTLSVGLGSTQPVISAATADLNGTLNITGFGASIPNTASALTSTQFNVIHTAAPGGITNDFSAVTLGGAGSPVDYLTLAGSKSANAQDYNVGFGLTWLAGATNGNGVFTLAGAGDLFNVDVALANQAGPFTSGWDGTTLTKAGAGTLILSAANTYTGPTVINGGTLRTGIANTFASSSAVTVAGGATLDLAGFSQTANNLSGAGSVTLGSATLTVNDTAPTLFSGAISGAGSLVKTGASTLTLTGDNTYTGLTTINTGTLQLGNGGTSGGVAGGIANNTALVVNRSNALTLAGTLSGTGAFTQAGSGTTVLSGASSTQGSVNVQQGTLKFLQNGDFTTTGNYTTQAGATTDIGQLNSTLRIGGVFTQAPNSTLDATLGASPDIVSGSAVLDGTLIIRGFSEGSTPVQASQVISQTYTMLHTTGGITGNFVNNPLAPSGLDYLLREGFVSANNLDYNLGFHLAWTQGGAADGTGTFTLAPNTAFDVDIPLGNQSVVFSSGWDGQSLTKNGEGLLVLSAVNTYTGTTTINAGTLRAGIANAFANSSAITLASGATLDLNGFNQIANNFSGAGDVTLGSAVLTANNTAASTFGGVIRGTGSLVKTGADLLTLTGDNTYTGGTTINAGTLQLGNGGTSGSLVGDIANNAALVVDRSDALALDGVISGTGSFAQAGAGTTTLSGANTYSGATNVTAGTLKAGAANAFSANSAHTVASGTTLDTGGFNQTVAALDNAGTVNLLSGVPGSTLTVTGAYVGHGGTLRIGTALGDSSSASDRLVLSGPGASASGTTNLQIANLGGLGALTTGNGIEVVTALNGATTTAQTTKDAFVLAGGTATAGLAKGNTALSAPHIDAGAYQYQLYAADANGQGENWYLRSTTTVSPGPGIPPVVVPTYRAEVPLAAALPAQLRQGDMAMLANLHRRVGDDDATRPSMDSDAALLDRRAWARVVYSDLNIRQDGTVNPQSSGYLNGLQAGVDLWSDAAWRAGLYVGYLQGGADVKGDARGVFGRVGFNDLQSRYLGGYATWTDTLGRYADAVLQAGDHRYSVRPDLNADVSGKAGSWTASVEVGQPFRLTEGWTIEPQAQLAYQKSSVDDLQLSGALVQQQTDAGWIGRLGVRVKGDMMTGAGRLQPYGRANLYYAGSGTDVARFVSQAAITDIASRTGYTSAELAVGMTLALNATTSLYGEVGHVFDVSGDARVRSSVQGSLGMRLRWN